jgi:hypothetical protein
VGKIEQMLKEKVAGIPKKVRREGITFLNANWAK